MHDFANKIRQIRGQKGLSRRAFGEALGITEGKIQKIEIGDQRADHEFLEILGKVFEVDLNWLLSKTASTTPPNSDNSHQNGKSIQIKRYDITASAGHGVVADKEIETGTYAFNQLWLNRRGLKSNNLSVISVVGDSMTPELSEGDLVLIDHAQAEVVDGRTFVVRFGDSLFVKHLQMLPMDQLVMLSANKDYQPIRLNMQTDAASFKVIGRVVASMHEW